MKKKLVEQGSKYHFSTVIPEYYDELSLRILACTPTLLYVYWNIPRDIPAYKSATIRFSYVKDHPEEAGHFLEIAITGNETSRYVETPLHHFQVKAVLGVRCASGTFQPLCTTLHPGELLEVKCEAAPVVSEAYPVASEQKEATAGASVEPLPMRNMIRAQALAFNHHQDAPSSWSAVKKPVHDSE